jgi:hypothetical protein
MEGTSNEQSIPTEACFGTFCCDVDGGDGVVGCSTERKTCHYPRNGGCIDRRNLETSTPVSTIIVTYFGAGGKDEPGTCLRVAPAPSGHCPAPSKMPELCRELPGSIVHRMRGRSRP